jgi:hypothetical protein
MEIENNPVYKKDLQLAGTAAPNDSAMQQFIALHMYGAQRAEHDTGACQDAVTTDNNVINTWNKTKNPNALVGPTNSDLAGDKQAMGSGTNPGDDARNIALDNQIIAADQTYLKQHPSGALSDQVRQEISLLQRDAKFSDNDRSTDEPKYIKDDNAFLAALKGGNASEIAAARQQMLSDRGADIQNEGRYISNDRKIQSVTGGIVRHLVTTDVMRQFGTLHLSDS